MEGWMLSMTILQVFAAIFTAILAWVIHQQSKKIKTLTDVVGELSVLNKIQTSSVDQLIKLNEHQNNSVDQLISLNKTQSNAVTQLIESNRIQAGNLALSILVSQKDRMPILRPTTPKPFSNSTPIGIESLWIRNIGIDGRIITCHHATESSNTSKLVNEFPIEIRSKQSIPLFLNPANAPFHFVLTIETPNENLLYQIFRKDGNMFEVINSMDSIIDDN